MGRKPSLSSTISTRDRILTAAMQRFSTQSYDETGLRDIAADAEVDVAYVHRSFGSKQQLFVEALRKAALADHFLDEISDDLVELLTRRLLSRASAKDGQDPLEIAVHSFSCPEAVKVHHAFVTHDLIGPLAEHLDGPAKHRAALMVAFLAGVTILRDVIGINELAASERSKIAPIVRDVFRAIANAEPTRAPKTANREGFLSRLVLNVSFSL